jgi:hypothetical protein
VLPLVKPQAIGGVRNDVGRKSEQKRAGYLTRAMLGGFREIRAVPHFDIEPPQQDTG